MDRSKFLKLVAGSGAMLFLPDWSATNQAVSAGDLPITLTPVKEGAALRTLDSLDVWADTRVVDIGFRRVVTPDYQLLYRATREMGSAFGPRIEWLVKDWRGKPKKEFNFTQIVRTPYGITNTEIASMKFGTDVEQKLIKMRKKALADHLSFVEYALKHGRRSEDGMVRRMGGVNDFSGKTLTLRALRDLQLLTNRQPNDMDMYQEELLSEVSLQVTK